MKLKVKKNEEFIAKDIILTIETSKELNAISCLGAYGIEREIIDSIEKRYPNVQIEKGHIQKFLYLIFTNLCY